MLELLGDQNLEGKLSSLLDISQTPSPGNTFSAVHVQAMLEQSKHLILLQAAGINQEQGLVDREVELVGLSKQHIQYFVGHELSPGMKEDLLAYLQKQPTVRSIACTPLNLEILRAIC